MIGKLTLRYIRKSKLRTLLTIFGIAVSMAMLTALGNIVISFTDNIINTRISESGKYDFSIENIEKKDIEKSKNISFLKDYYFLDNSKQFRNYSKNIDNHYYAIINLFEGDEKYFREIFSKKLISGRMPQKENEIIVPYMPKNTIVGMEKLGQTVELTQYDRLDNKYIYKNFSDEENIEVDINLEKLNMKFLSNPGQKNKYTVVGYFDQFTYSKTNIEKDKNVRKYYFDIYGYTNKFQKGKLYGFFDNYEDIPQKYNKLLSIFNKTQDEVFINEDYIKNIDTSKHYAWALFSNSVVFLSVIILFATIVFIYNIFSTNYVEKIKDFGLLKVVGFTNRQLFKMVLIDSFIYFLIAVPLGYLAGIISMKIVFGYVNNIINNMIIGVPLTFESNTSLVVFSVVFILGVFVIFISNILASILVFVKSPIQALQGNIKNKPVKIKKSKPRKFIRKLFGYEGFLAYKNIDRNRKRFIMSMLSISMSIILFVIVSNISNLLSNDLIDQKEKFEDSAGYIIVHEKYKDDIVNKIEGLDFVELKNVEKIEDIKYSKEGLHYSIIIKKLGKDNAASAEFNSILFEYPGVYQESNPYPIIKILKVFLYGFITLIIIIGSLNVFNSTYTNMLTREREIALLNAVGIEENKLKKIIVLESLISALFSSILALIFSLAITFIQYNITVNSGGLGQILKEFINYTYPIRSWFLGMSVSFVIIYISSIIPYKKMANKNITNILR